VLNTGLVFRFNDGGRRAAGFGPPASDCVVRSVAIASGRPYAVVYGELAEINAKMPKTKARDHGRSKVGSHTADHGVYTESVLFKRYMASLGFTWTPTMSIGSGCRVHLRPGELPKGRIIVRVTRHLVAVIDGTVHDIADPCRGGTRCVYGYWRKS
jgi:hypothetical protein